MLHLESVNYQKVKMTGGFWKKWQDVVADNTVDAVYEQFDASGRVAAMGHTWRTGEPNKPHIFYDSDMAKWIEGAQEYYLQQYKDSGNVLTPDGLGSFDAEEMHALADAVRPIVPTVQVRGVE